MRTLIKYYALGIFAVFFFVSVITAYNLGNTVAYNTACKQEYTKDALEKVPDKVPNALNGY